MPNSRRRRPRACYPDAKNVQDRTAGVGNKTRELRVTFEHHGVIPAAHPHPPLVGNQNVCRFSHCVRRRDGKIRCSPAGAMIEWRNPGVAWTSTWQHAGCPHVDRSWRRSRPSPAGDSRGFGSRPLLCKTPPAPAHADGYPGRSRARQSALTYLSKTPPAPAHAGGYPARSRARQSALTCPSKTPPAPTHAGGYPARSRARQSALTCPRQ
jgi:hypothetical protein